MLQKSSRFLLLLVSFTSWLCAQSPLGTVTGVATDPSGAPIAGATVVLSSDDTGVKRESVTNESGIYSFPNLTPGRYQLSSTASGFRPLKTDVFEVTAFRTIRQDLRFELESAASEITVNELASAVIETESPSVTTSLTSKQILELPTNLRSVFNNSGDSGLIFTMMPLTIPGLVQVGAGAAWTVPGSGQNGIRTKVDGIEANFGNFGTPDPVSQPSMESVGEFTANVLTNRAEFSGMGTITTVTKSGTNQYHGDIFWYIQNSALHARNAFQTTRPFSNIHNYGISGGGPLRKDKTFFYGTFDGTRGSRAYSFAPNVPTVAMRQGDFTGFSQIVNPFTSQPFPGNRIPNSLMSPEALRAQELLYPLPNFGPPNLTAGNYRANFNGPEVHRIFEVRLDHNWTSGHSTFARYQNKHSDYEIPGAREALPPTSTGTSTNIRYVHFWTLGDIFTIRPNIFNEFRAGVAILVSQSSADRKGQPVLDAIGIQGLPDRSHVAGLPRFEIAGLSTYWQRLLNPVNDGRWQLSDNLTWIKGRHSLKFGVEYINWFVNRYLPTEPALFGQFNFSSRFTGNAYADFLLGLPNQVTRLDPYPTQYARFQDVSFYAQDDFKVTQRLTLSYGLRYEYNGTVRMKDDNLYTFDIARGVIVVPTERSKSLFSPFFPSSIGVMTADQAGLPRNLRDADMNNFAPRFGFSYMLNDRTVVRGGWGIYYGHFSVPVVSSLASGPYSVSTTSINSITNGVPLFTLANPFAAPGSTGALNLAGIAPNLRNPYSMQYSFSIERELTRDLGVRISYIGSRGVNLPYRRNVNQPLPSTIPFSASRRPYAGFNTIDYAENGANSLYSGLQVVAQKRFNKGLMFMSGWTWAKSLSEVDDTGNAELNTQIENAYDRARDRADAYAVPRHQWMNQVLYELPLGKGKLLAGWQLNALINLSTGHFLNPVYSGGDPANIGVTGGRPDVVKEVTYPETLNQWFDRTAFAVPPAGSGRFGNAARNSVVGPGYAVFNLGLGKTTTFERIGSIQIAASFQNVLNHLNYGQPNMTVNVAQGGSITSSHIFPPAGSARSGQLSLRWRF